MKKDIGKLVGERVRHYRRQRKMSQEELGYRASLHTSYIGEIERGEKSPTLESLSKLSLALDISLSELFDHLQPVQPSQEAQIIKGIISRLHTLPAKELESIDTMVEIMVNFRKK